MQHRLKLSSATLFLANLAPLAGVLLLGWSVSSVVVLYWFENIVIGVLNIARMIALPREPSFVGPPPAIIGHGLKLFLIPFFVVHYFLFCAGHGVFVFGMFPDDTGYFPGPNGIALLGTLLRAIEIFFTPLAFAAAALAASHVISFVVNYLGGREFERLDIQSLMMQPYGRIVVLHLTIIFGGFATMALGEPIWLLVVLVLVKTGVDLKMHLRQHLESAGGENSKIEDMPADERDLAARGRPVR